MSQNYNQGNDLKVSLSRGSLSSWSEEPTVIDYGMILICRSGSATLKVNFNSFDIRKNSVLTVFPNDVVVLTYVTSDFNTEFLRYDATTLREASLQLEQTVYYRLRQDRCRTDSKVLTDIINTMFVLLKIYFVQDECRCLNQLVLLQLKAFFLGFHDYIQRFPAMKTEEKGSQRMRELFNKFMYLLENRFKESRDVAYFASLMNITPKYLSVIVRHITGHRVKTVIDHYVVLQLKLTLRSSDASMKEIAWQYRFSDLSFFCRYFKRHTGLTPQQFQKKLMDVED